MAPSPKRIEQDAKVEVKPKAEKPVPPRKINCFVLSAKPDKPGLLLVSTTQTQDGCYVLGWQPQSTNWLVSEGTLWYPFAAKMLKVNMGFTCIFAVGLLFVLYINRNGR